MASKLERARQSARRVRENAKKRRASLIRKGSAVATGYAIGKMNQSGTIERIPTVAGIPRTVMLAGIATGVSFVADGMLAEVADGIGSGAGVVAAYQFGNGDTISGAEDDAELEQLEAALDEAMALEGVSGDEEVIEYIEG